MRNPWSHLDLMAARFHFLYVIVSFAFARALIPLAATPTAPRPSLNNAVSCAVQMQPAQGNKVHQQYGKEVKQDMKIDLTTRELPPKGLQPGVFADVIQGEKADKRGKRYKTLTLVGQLQAVKTNGQQFIAKATYNLDDNRGVKHLIDDLKTWRGTNAIPDIGNFDPEAEFYGKPFFCDPIFGDEKGAKVIGLRSFRPDPEKQVALNPGYVRAKDQQRASTEASTSPQGAAQPPAPTPVAA